MAVLGFLTLAEDIFILEFGIDQTTSRLSHHEWFFKPGIFDPPAVVNRLRDKRREALSRGYARLRVNKSSHLLYKHSPRQFSRFEKELGALIAEERVIVLCTFFLHESDANQVLDAARTHQLTAARRNGAWEVIETSDLAHAAPKIV